ncbi:MAG TPA: glycosyltransferase family A protein [Flavobacterium sp.]|nr:glycosyltransferase family A protein [Flavobacterium sp.]
MKRFAILISTKNRLPDLIFTLGTMGDILERPDVECIICDDGSTDGTSDFIKTNYPEILLVRHETSKGYIFSRNMLLRLTSADYAISLDDDAHFLSDSPLEKIEIHFTENPKCGLIAFRLLWSKSVPPDVSSSANTEIVKGFVGCGHVWRMKAWRDIPDYPEWFVFYGEEDFAAYQLFKKGWQVHYLPSVLVQHRVDMKARRNDVDFTIRLRRALRAGWYIYFLFLPKRKIPKQFLYSIWQQHKTKIFRGDLKVLKSLILAFSDLVISIPKIIRYSNRLTFEEYQQYKKLGETKTFWKPEK